MRKSILCLFALVSMFSFSQNEESTEDKFDLGFRFGLSLSDLVTDVNTVAPRATFLTGIHMEYKINSNWSIQPELLYVRKGEFSRNTLQESNLRTENRLLLDYIELPILAKYNLNRSLYFEAGPYISHLVAAKQESIEGSNFQSSSVFQQIENIDSGIAVGATYKTEWNFFMGMRYTHGFINVFNNAFVNYEKSYNAQFQMYLGYSF